ncbi:MAG: hypothetical protein JOZ52_14885, partial [Acidobacteria bacterium]|nr:hypothetical protein [Acidobacteriota bacterium]
MRRSRLFLLLLLMLALMPVFARLSSANLSLRIDETQTQVKLRESQSEVTLAVANPSGQELTTHVICELLDTQDNVRASIERDETILSGTTLLKLPLATSFSNANQNEVLWYRLRYSVTPVFEGAGFDAAQGIISLSEITPGMFNLRVASPSHLAEATSYTARVRATHPINSKPVGGVSLKAEIELISSASDDGKEATIKTTATTDADGYATLVFKLPRKLEARGYAQLRVYGELDAFTQETY